MRNIGKFFLFALLVFGLERGIRTQTDGFRVEKIASDFPIKEQWETPQYPLKEKLLDQRFTYLGSGVQCYAFLGEDQKTVLKVFKHYHFGLSSKILRKLPVPSFLKEWKQTVLEKREKRIESIFTSAQLASDTLATQTGVLFLNLNPKKGMYSKVTLYDKIGVRHEIDLGSTPFLLQKKADLLFSYLDTHKEQTKQIIDSLFTCIGNRSKLGISNNDPVVYRNFGIFKGRVIEIDVGSFAKSPYVTRPLFSKRELFYETLELKNWVNTYAPELSDYFEEKLIKAIRI